MKITLKQLKQIIKEEISRVNENQNVNLEDRILKTLSAESIENVHGVNTNHRQKRVSWFDLMDFLGVQDDAEFQNALTSLVSQNKIVWDDFGLVYLPNAPRLHSKKFPESPQD